METGDLVGRLQAIVSDEGRMFGVVDGFRYPLGSLAWVPSPEAIRKQKAQARLRHFLEQRNEHTR